jgi:hypothetical protein
MARKSKSEEVFREQHHPAIGPHRLVEAEARGAVAAFAGFLQRHDVGRMGITIQRGFRADRLSHAWPETLERDMAKVDVIQKTTLDRYFRSTHSQPTG